MNIFYGDADFDIELSDLWGFQSQPSESFGFRKFRKIQNEKAIIRTDTGDVLGIVSGKYKLVSHKEMIDNQRKILQASMYANEYIEETITTNKSGSKCFVKHVLPKVGIETPDGDNAALSFLGVNSLDGTMPFLLSVGARQSACLNGQIFTQGAATLYKHRHSSALDIEKAATLINRALFTLSNEVELWHDWYRRGTTDEEACGEFKNILGIEDDAGSFETERRNKNFDYLKNSWFNTYSKRLGKNKWAVYNTLTDWSTHAEVSKNSSLVSVQRVREDKIRKALDDKFFLPPLRSAV